MNNIALRFLYRTLPGRAMLKLLTRPGLSRLAGRYLDSRASRWLIPLAIRAWHVELSEFESRDYPSFNAFFTRRRRLEYMRIDMQPERLISPCDGLLSACPIDSGSRFFIKGSHYGIGELLGDGSRAEGFAGGDCLIFRLTPANYHRYCFIDSAVLAASGTIPGVLHCVRPIACECEPVYVRNSRAWTLLRTEHFGAVAQIEIGALLVGRIVNEALGAGARVRRGQEKGRFEFGGSTIVLLFEPGRIALDAAIRTQLERGGEYPVRQGQAIGSAL